MLTFLPILIWLGIALAKSNDVTKTALALSITVAGILTLVNLLLKYSIRSTVWILLIGIYVALRNITPLLIIIAVCTIIDEFIVHPLYKHYKERYHINKEIDKRTEV
jgi:membrane protein YdbS with pleckstrin-like domain